jgi:uncharacterized protein with PIN domain
LTRTHFACDQHLGKLARLLRILGFDTLYRQDWGEAELARSATDKDRAVLTCNRSLLKRKQVISGRLIRSRQVDTQATEVVRRFGLAEQPNLFGRCALCNHPLEAVSKDQVWDQIPNQTRHWRDEYSRCPHCHHLYWEGTHVPRLLSRIEAIFERANTGE